MDDSGRPVRGYRQHRARHVENAVMSTLARAGLVPHTYLLTTRGRRTGRTRSNPVTIVEHDDRRWLVAPYGPVAWVHNARASGEVRLSRRGHADDYAVREVPAPEAGPVLRKYLGIAPAARPYFAADADSPAQDLVAEATRHPVFELTPTEVYRGGAH